MQLEIERGDFNKQSMDTYQEVYDLWIEQYENTVKESTFVKTKGIFKNHILPALGAYRIEKINVQLCQKHINTWFKKLKNFRMVKAYASMVLDYALNLGIITSNPMNLVTMPKSIATPGEVEPLRYYTKDELTKFMNCLEAETNRKAYTLFRLLAFSGMRKGEALALTWEDINFKKNELHINKALARGENNRLIIQTPKIKHSNRTLIIDNKTMQVLKEWKKRQMEEGLILGFNTMQPKQLIFNSNTNSLMQPTKTRKWIIYIQEKYDLPKIRTHDLRHTHATLLFEAGATIKEVQDRLGHKDMKTTMDTYTHVTEKLKNEAANKFANYMDI
ncbi:MAG: site-specific integrase [Kurthia sp.]|nr:site-specific integrase [Candidatus Kurthia equi]